MSAQAQAAIVTGEASGIGLAIVDALWQQGAHVLVADLTEPKSDGLATRHADRLWSRRHDIADEASWVDLFDGCRRRDFVQDLLVNCAGILVPVETDAMTPALFDKTMAVNAGGTLLGCRSFVAALASSGKAGAIVDLEDCI